MSGEDESLLNPEGHDSDPLLAALGGLLGFEPFECGGNCRNVGQIPQLPPDAVVETRCRYDAAGVHPFASPMPAILEVLVRPHVLRQEALIDVAFEGSFDDLVALVSTDPLCWHLDFAQCRTMVSEMLTANRGHIRNERLMKFC